MWTREVTPHPYTKFLNSPLLRSGWIIDFINVSWNIGSFRYILTRKDCVLQASDKNNIMKTHFVEQVQALESLGYCFAE